ncbi:MAG: hypothetical protein SFZ02_00800 [bacterium]|nr:hypothetical protein [bacterium]
MPMVYHDWRLLVVLFIIMLLMMSCTGQIISPDATTILMPSVTLTVHIAQALSPTALGIATTFIIPTPTPISPIFDDQSITLNVPNPICYDNDLEGILCLGVVNNPYLTGFKDIEVLVELFKPNGSPLIAKSTALLQQSLPAEGSAPYHVRFDKQQNISADDFGAVRVSVIHFTPLAQAPSAPVVTLQDVTNQQDNRRYLVTGKLVHSQAQSGEGVRMIITLYDAYEHVAGYRVMEIPEFLQMPDMPFSLELTPQIRGTSLRYTIYLEQMP